MANQNTNPPGSSKDWYTATTAGPRQTPGSSPARESTGYGTGPGTSAGPGMGPTAGSRSSVASPPSAIDDEQERRSSESTASKGSSTSSPSSSSYSSFDVNQLRDRASKTAKTVYEKASTFVKENPRAAAGIGLALGALILRRMTRR